MKRNMLLMVVAFSLVVSTAAAGLFLLSDMKSADGEGFHLKESKDKLSRNDLPMRPQKAGDLPLFPGSIIIKGNPNESKVEVSTARLQAVAENSVIQEVVDELGITVSVEEIKKAVVIRPLFSPEDSAAKEAATRSVAISVDIMITETIDDSLAYDLSAMLLYKLSKTSSEFIPMVSARPPWLENKPLVPMDILIELNNAHDKYMSELQPNGTIESIYHMEDGTKKVFINGEPVE